MAEVRLYEGQILDGRNRYAACQIVGFPIENSTTNYEGSDPIGYVISANLKRRSACSDCFRAGEC